jgi:quercetin dioxygenase-like cupin family protein
VAAGWKSVRLEEIEPIPVVGGTLLWRPVRRTLDVGAFGVNAYTAPKAGDEVVEEHTEESLGHEEIYVVLQGRATFTLDDETLDAPAGTVVFVRDPKVKRHAQAAEPDTAVLAVGGPRGGAYEPSPWEDYFAAERRATTTRTCRSSPTRSSAGPIIPRPSTTSRAPRRSRGARTTRWHM